MEVVEAPEYDERVGIAGLVAARSVVPLHPLEVRCEGLLQHLPGGLVGRGVAIAVATGSSEDRVDVDELEIELNLAPDAVGIDVGEEALDLLPYGLAHGVGTLRRRVPWLQECIWTVVVGWSRPVDTEGGWRER